MKRNLFFPTLLICITIFLVGCSNQKQIETPTKNTTPEQIQNKPSANPKANIHVDFTGFNMTKDNVGFQVDGKTLNLKLPIYLDKNRYYISLNEFTNQLNGSINRLDNSLHIEINNNSYTINLTDKIVKCPDKEFSLKKTLLNENDMYYIGFSDFSYMLNLYTRWDKDNKTISCTINGFNKNNVSPYQSKIKQIGLIRLEDIGVSSQAYDKNYFERLRIIANYMNERKVPYHIAWIPRYVIPSCGIDNDPLTKNNFEIAEMVYSLDYFTTHNGIIGLHGYTHQCGNTESAVGFEFGKVQPSADIFKNKIEKAIETASYLDIPIDFFEAPHYEITPKQNKIAEKYFKILYYPFCDYGPRKIDLSKPQLSPYNKSSYYISTALDYIPAGRESLALANLQNANINNMGSVFYHPNLESNFISLTTDSNGAPTFTYNDNSTLKKLVSILEKKGFNMIKVTDIH